MFGGNRNFTEDLNFDDEEEIMFCSDDGKGMGEMSMVRYYSHFRWSFVIARVSKLTQHSLHSCGSSIVWYYHWQVRGDHHGSRVFKSLELILPITLSRIRRKRWEQARVHQHTCRVLWSSRDIHWKKGKWVARRWIMCGLFFSLTITFSFYEPSYWVVFQD